MRLYVPVAAVCAILLAALPCEGSRVRRGPTAAKHKPKAAAAAPHQRAMDDARATQIQEALVKAGYLNEATGHWDAASQAAMQKMQGDNGWQTKIIPDSRALIKLGLGPNASDAGKGPGTQSASAAGLGLDADRAAR